MKERRKDLPWLLLALLAIAFTVTYGWYQLHRSTNEVLLVHRNDALIMTESIEQQGSLTTGGLKDAVIKDENGKRISYEELEEVRRAEAEAEAEAARQAELAKEQERMEKMEQTVTHGK